MSAPVSPLARRRAHGVASPISPSGALRKLDEISNLHLFSPTTVHALGQPGAGSPATATPSLPQRPRTAHSPQSSSALDQSASALPSMRERPHTATTTFTNTFGLSPPRTAAIPRPSSASPSSSSAAFITSRVDPPRSSPNVTQRSRLTSAMSPASASTNSSHFQRTPPANPAALEPVRMRSPHSLEYVASSTSASPASVPAPTASCRAVLRACAYCMKGAASIHTETHDVKRLRALVLSDDDEQEDQLFVCKLCRAAYFCSVACQRSAWKLHRAPCNAHCEASLVAAVEMRSAADCRQVYLPANDPRIDAAAESPVMQRCGIPLALFPLFGFGRAENEWCQRFMMDPLTGVPDAAHRSVSAALIVRRDHMPITPQHVYQLGEFFALIAERFEDDDDADAAGAMMTQARFVAFLADHVRIGGRQKYANEMGVSW